MKKLLVLLCLIIMIFCFAGCESANDVYDRERSEAITDAGFIRIKTILEYGDYYVYLVYDKKSKVEYMWVDGFYEFSICPYYDENGEVVIYKGE